MSSQSEIVPVELANGKVIQIEATVLGGEEDVGFGVLSFDGVTEAIEGITEALVATLEKVQPRKASVEFGLEVAVESGKLTALFVKGSGTASLKITLEWSDEKPST